MSVTYRDCCGSLRGMIAHQVAGEDPCGWCRQAETTARLAAEAITWKPTAPNAVLPQAGDSLEPVAPVQAAVNAAVLVAEIEAYEHDHPGSSNYRSKDAVRRRLRVA